MRKLIGALLAGAAFVAPAMAQNTVPQTGVVQGYVFKNTYAAISVGLVPAASATDIFCIAGSASKTIQLVRIEASGIAGTLATSPLVLLRRNIANTGGTAATTTAAPNLTQGPYDPSAVGAASATLIAYTANPTINDSSPTYLRARYLTTPTAAAGTNSPNVVWTFGEATNALNGPPTLRGANQQLCLNLQGTSISSGVLEINVEWTEQ